MDDILLDKRFDNWICGYLMYEHDFGYNDGTCKPIKDSGKTGSERIYKTLKYLEELKGIKL